MVFLMIRQGEPPGKKGCDVKGRKRKGSGGGEGKDRKERLPARGERQGISVLD